MEETMEFSAEDLEIVELPQREALGKGGGGHTHVNQHGSGGLFGPISVIIDLL